MSKQRMRHTITNWRWRWYEIHWVRLQSISTYIFHWISGLPMSSFFFIQDSIYINYVNARPSSLRLFVVPVHHRCEPSRWKFMSEMFILCADILFPKKRQSAVWSMHKHFEACARKVNKCFISFIYYMRWRSLGSYTHTHTHKTFRTFLITFTWEPKRMSIHFLFIHSFIRLSS